jgi:hypothetical protein
MNKIELFLLFLLGLLAISVVVGIIRKSRGGTLLPPRDPGDDNPRTLEEMVRRKRQKP